MSTQQRVLNPLIKKIIDEILTVRIPEMIISFLSSKFKQIEDLISGHLEKKMFQDCHASHVSSNKTFTPQIILSEDDLESIHSVLISISTVKPKHHESQKILLNKKSILQKKCRCSFTYFKTKSN